MPFKITSQWAVDVPMPGKTGKVNEDLVAVRDAMKNLAPGMVLEIQPGQGKSTRGVKTLVSRAAKDLGAEWQHWSADGKVYAKPTEEPKRRGRSRKTA